ncbi:hypothetical protein, partial [Actinobacillus pleuropneumoniae]
LFNLNIFFFSLDLKVAVHSRNCFSPVLNLPSTERILVFDIHPYARNYFQNDGNASMVYLNFFGASHFFALIF